MDFTHWPHYRLFWQAFTEKLDLDEVVDELADFDRRHRLILRRHVAVLGWWSLLNILIGGPVFVAASGFWFYFAEMSITWGIINFAVTMWIMDHAMFRKFRRGDSFERFEVQRHGERLILFNIGLDLAYIFAGLFLQAHQCCPGNAPVGLWAGLGWAVVFQGVFLFGLDNLFFRVHARNFRKARPFLEQLLPRP